MKLTCHNSPWGFSVQLVKNGYSSVLLLTSTFVVKDFISGSNVISVGFMCSAVDRPFMEKADCLVRTVTLTLGIKNKIC